MRQPHPRPLIVVLSPSPGLIRTPTSPICHTLRHLADRSVHLLQPSLAGEVRTSVRSMARVRAARCSLGGGASSLQSDVVVACGLRGRALRVRSADRICASWRLLSEPEQEHHPRAAQWTTGRRLGCGLAVASGDAVAIGGPSAVCRRGAVCVLGRVRWRARHALVAAEDATRGRVRRARVRPSWTHPDGCRRVECECVRVSCARLCVCSLSRVRYSMWAQGPRGEQSADVQRRP